MLKKLLFLSIVCMNMNILVAQEAPAYARIFKAVLDKAYQEEKESQFATARRILQYLATNKQSHAAYIPDDIRGKADRALKDFERSDEAGKNPGARWAYGFFMKDQPDRRDYRTKYQEEDNRKDELKNARNAILRDIETELCLPAGSLRLTFV